MKNQKAMVKLLTPITKYDIQCMSIGFLADQQTPMIWRGPMVTSAIKTFHPKSGLERFRFYHR